MLTTLGLKGKEEASDTCGPKETVLVHKLGQVIQRLAELMYKAIFKSPRCFYDVG